MSRINRIKNKFGYATRGLYIAFTTDNSFKVHFAVSIPIIISGFAFHFSRFEWIIIIISIGQVLVAELFNTAIEYIVKMFTDEYHKLAETLLDISAGAVLLAVIISAILGSIVYIPHFLA